MRSRKYTNFENVSCTTLWLCLCHFPILFIYICVLCIVYRVSCIVYCWRKKAHHRSNKHKKETWHGFSLFFFFWYFLCACISVLQYMPCVYTANVWAFVIAVRIIYLFCIKVWVRLRMQYVRVGSVYLCNDVMVCETCTIYLLRLYRTVSVYVV